MTEQQLDELINRINELAHKAKAEGLTPEEQAEQAELRGRFLTNFRQNFRKELERIDVKQPDGTIVNLGERYDDRHQK